MLVVPSLNSRNLLFHTDLGEFFKGFCVSGGQNPSFDVYHSWEVAEGSEVTRLLSHQVSEVGWITTCRLQLHFCSSDCTLGKLEIKPEQKLQAWRKGSGE